jgi:hypothetical protein
MCIYIYVLDEQVVGRAYPRKDATWPRAPDQEGQNHFHLFRWSTAAGAQLLQHYWGFPSLGVTSKAGWLISMGKSIYKWMMTGGTKMDTSIW